MADGDDGMKPGSCPNRAESTPMNTTSRSLVLMNYFRTNPNNTAVCSDNSAPLVSMLNTCMKASGKRWANYIAVDYYMVLNKLSNFFSNSCCKINLCFSDPEK